MTRVPYQRDILVDRFYCTTPNDIRKREVYTTVRYDFSTLAKLQHITNEQNQPIPGTIQYE